MMNTEQNQTPPAAANQQVKPATTPHQPKTGWWITAVLLFTVLAAGGIYILQLQQTKNQPVNPPTQTKHATPQPTQPAAGTEEFAVPTVSEETNLDTLEQEINQTQIDSPASELDKLDAAAGQL